MLFKLCRKREVICSEKCFKVVLTKMVGAEANRRAIERDILRQSRGVEVEGF